MAQNRSTSADQDERIAAVQLASSSYKLSITGIIVGIICVVIVIVIKISLDSIGNNGF